jgi:hypothetical protein
VLIVAENLVRTVLNTLKGTKPVNCYIKSEDVIFGKKQRDFGSVPVGNLFRLI